VNGRRELTGLRFRVSYAICAGPAIDPEATSTLPVHAPHSRRS